MDNIYNFLKNAWLKAKEEVKSNPILLVVLVLITLPFPYKYNSISVMILAGFCLFSIKRQNLHFTKSFFFLIGLYVLMLLSLLWTIQFDLSTRAVSKTLPFLIIPLIFSIVAKITPEVKQKIVLCYAYTFSIFALLFLLNATVRFLVSQNTNVFFYHELVSFDLNAIHFSVFMSIAFFALFTLPNKRIIDKIALLILFVMIILLSSKNIIVLFFILLGIHLFYISKWRFNVKRMLLLFGLVLICGFAFFGKIKNRFLVEIESNRVQNSINNEISGPQGLVYNVSVYDAWTKDQFQHNDYFPGLAMRVYQARIFLEMMSEDQAYLTGYGINATQSKIASKRVEHNLYPGYEKFNFHNQYIQFFAELGILGFLFLVFLLAVNLKNAINNKDLVHFSFAVLMISLFLTESFLARQRGVVFFVTLYCVFNSVSGKESKKK